MKSFFSLLQRLCLLFSFSNFVSYAQTQPIKFQRIGITDGLSQSNVAAVIQDETGFMWIGTQDGLNKFDGYHFKKYRNNPANRNSLVHNEVTVLFEDRDDRIWIGSRNGLSLFNPRLEKFTTFTHSDSDSTSINNSSIRCIFQDREGVIFIGTAAGLNQFIQIEEEPVTWQFKRFKSQQNPDNRHLYAGIVHSVCEDSFGRIWLATHRKEQGSLKDIGALTVYDKSKGTFAHYYDDPGNPNSLSSSAVQSLFCDSRNRLWVGTIDGGVNVLEFSADSTISKINRFVHNPADRKTVAHNYISKILEDKNGYIWLGTYGGLSLFQPATNDFLNFRYVAEDITTLSANKINDLCSDNAGNLWVATDTGMNLYIPSTKKIVNYAYQPQNEKSIIGGDVFGILEDSDGDIWVTSYGAGLTRILSDAAGNETFIKYPFDPAQKENALKTNLLLGMIEDPDKNIWIASYDGLFVIRKTDATRSASFTHYLPEAGNDNSLRTKYFLDLYNSPEGTIWARTYQNGLEEIEIREGKLYVNHHPGKPGARAEERIIAAAFDSFGALWATTREGLYRVFRAKNRELEFVPVRYANFDQQNFVKFHIHTFFRNVEQELWIGTANGLLKLTFNSNRSDTIPNELMALLKIFSEESGLPNNTVYAIAADGNKNLWLSTNKGLSKFNPATEVFRNYDIGDGLLTNEFNANAVAKGKDGAIFFGGINGFVRFHPDSIKDNTFMPPVVLTSLKILNKTVKISQNGKTPLNESIVYSRSIELSYKDYVFSLEFAALNFNKAQKNRYAYRLEGFHDDWINAGYERSAVFTNLDPGNYIFRVKGSNNDGVWNKEGASIKIIITPPPWQTWWAYTLYGLFIFASIARFVRYKIHSAEREAEAKAAIERAKTEERERVRRNSSADFHDEAGHMITRITLFLELAKRKTGADAKLTEYLHKIEENTKALSSGMRDFIWGLDPEKDSLFDTLLRLKEFGNTLFQHSEIRFQVSGIHAAFKQVNLPMHHRRSIMFIFKEAMNNCLKHSGADSAILKAEIDSTALRITFEDNGAGFAKANENDGYGLKNMAARSEKIGASLEISSVAGEGTRICFKKILAVKRSKENKSQND